MRKGPLRTFSAKVKNLLGSGSINLDDGIKEKLSNLEILAEELLSTDNADEYKKLQEEIKAYNALMSFVSEYLKRQNPYDSNITVDERSIYCFFLSEYYRRNIKNITNKIKAILPENSPKYITLNAIALTEYTDKVDDHVLTDVSNYPIFTRVKNLFTRLKLIFFKPKITIVGDNHIIAKNSDSSNLLRSVSVDTEKPAVANGVSEGENLSAMKTIYTASQNSSTSTSSIVTKELKKFNSK